MGDVQGRSIRAGSGQPRRWNADRSSACSPILRFVCDRVRKCDGGEGERKVDPAQPAD